MPATNQYHNSYLSWMLIWTELIENSITFKCNILDGRQRENVLNSGQIIIIIIDRSLREMRWAVLLAHSRANIEEANEVGKVHYTIKLQQVIFAVESNAMRTIDHGSAPHSSDIDLLVGGKKFERSSWCCCCFGCCCYCLTDGCSIVTVGCVGDTQDIRDDNKK